jgi:hypothetical protein
MTTTILCNYLQFSFEILGCSAFLGFSFYFEWLSLERGSGIHCMVHSCSDGVYGGIEWLFQLKGNEGIEIVFQWF